MFLKIIGLLIVVFGGIAISTMIGLSRDGILIGAIIGASTYILMNTQGK